MTYRLFLGASLLLGSLTAHAAALELAPGEIRINVGTSSLTESREVIDVLRDEFGARLVRHLDRISASTVVINRHDLDRIRRHRRILALADYVERDRRAFIPEDATPWWIEYDHGNPTLNATPNDPSYSRQWAMPCIDMARAWDRVGFRERDVAVAIIDTGSDLDHPDLNAHIDTANDYDFVNNDSTAEDDNGHGTHTAGIAAAETNNGVGVAGVLNAGIIPIKVLDWFGGGYWSDVAAGIDHAVSVGADVISMSIGGGSDSSVRRACDAAWDAGLLLFGSAGNHGGYSLNYPSAYTSVIGVGSLQNCTRISSFSGRGFGDETTTGNVEIVGGGSDIYSTWSNGGYSSLSGTSMSCPQAAGLGLGYMALASGWSNAKMRNHIQANADNIGNADTFGFGRIDAYPWAD